jgi:hypothetical protein
MSDDDARGQQGERWVLPGGKRAGRRVSSGIGVVALLGAAAIGQAVGATPALAASVQSSAAPSLSSDAAAVPSITSMGPGYGLVAGGTQVTIDGSGFGTTAGTVTIGGTEATIDSWSDSSVVFTTPPGDPGAALVVVTTTDGVSSTTTIAFIYQTVTVTPSITGVSPDSGPVTGGQQITITGTNFGTDTSTVTIGGNQAGVVSWSPTSVVVTTPAGTLGQASIILTAGGATSNSFGYTYTAVPPTVTSLDPQGGPDAGGELVTIYGSNLGTTPGTVTIGGNNAPVLAWTTNTIVVTAPAGNPGDTDVVVTVGGVQLPGLLFTYDLVPPTPVISSVAPGVSPTTGGTQITITGTNFGSPTLGSVTVGGNAATVISWSDTSIVATTPPGPAGPAEVVVTANGVSSTGLAIDYQAASVPPTVSSLSPASGTTAGGEQVTITGTGFGTTAGIVTIGGNLATVDSWSDTSIVVTTPPGTAGPATVTVTADGVTASGPSFTYEAPVVIPIVTGFSPASGSTAGGEQETITGTNFGATPGTVTFGGNTATIVSWTDTSVVVTVPAGAPGNVEIVLTTAAGVPSDGVTFTYEAPPTPTVSSISPASGSTAGGTQVTITGTNFGTTPGTVTIGGNGATLVSWSDTSIVVTTPPGTAGPATVTADGVTASGPSFTYEAPVVTPSPSITGISPNHGPTAGGERLTITGTNFGTAKGSVTIGGKAATVVSWSDTSVVVTAPAGSPGAAVVNLTANGHRSNSAVFNYDRVVTPVRTSVRLSASADPSALHGKVTFTAIVTAATGRADPAGTVRFTVDGKPLGSPVKLVNGRATSAAITTLTAGDHQVAATYVPAAGFQASSASLTEVVQQGRRSPGHRDPWSWFRPWRR